MSIDWCEARALLSRIKRMECKVEYTNPAIMLEGVTLDGGWVVGPMRKKAFDDTGGHFSVSYVANHPDGRLGFVKVLDFARTLESDDALHAMAVMTADFELERNLCISCGQKRLSKIVTALDYGTYRFEKLGPFGSAHYIIFEHATRDIRRALSDADSIDNVVKLEYLHNVAVGLRQLHGAGVAHQDLKPSNFLAFGENVRGRSLGKIADLGRAFQATVPSRIDQLITPGDSNYAPPEQQYRYAHPDVSARRFGADLYQLGSLACFFFTRATMNAFLSRNLDPKHHWMSFGDGYLQALPYVEQAFEASLDEISLLLPPSLSTDLTKLISALCHPRPEERTHPSRRRWTHANRFALEPYVSQIDLMARRESMRSAD